MDKDLQESPVDPDFQQCSSDVTRDQKSERPRSHLDRDGVRDEDRIEEVQGDVQRPPDVLGGHEEEDPAADVDRGLHQDQDLRTAAANEDEAWASCDGVPALVVTQAEEVGQKGMMGSKASATAVKPPPSPEPPERPEDLVWVSSDPSLSCGRDGGDATCADLLSLRSDCVSLASETTVSRRSEEDDTRSVSASSVLSVFHRLQLDPLEKAWWRSSALGTTVLQRQLLAEEPGLVVKKDFVTTALHWAAKQGRQDVVDMMLRSGADVNVRSGYTPLHLASIHGHQDVVSSLVNDHNAKTSVRDYHGKTAVHYWSGCSDVFHRAETQEGGRFSGGRRTQRSSLSSLLMFRSRSQGQRHLEFRTTQTSSHDTLDLQV